MNVIGVILLVVFLIVCVLMVGIVLIQDDQGGGLGGLLGGSNTAAFGSQSSNVVTKATYVLVILFFVTSFALAFVNKAPKAKSLDGAIQQTNEVQGTQGEWLDEEDDSPVGLQSIQEQQDGTGNSVPEQAAPEKAE